MNQATAGKKKKKKKKDFTIVAFLEIFKSFKRVPFR